MCIVKKYIVFLLLLTQLISCSKEYSYEGGTFPAGENDSAAKVNNACLSVGLRGYYIAGSNLGLTHQIELEVDVIRTGDYSFKTNTVNGYSFSAIGNFTSLGTHRVVLQGNGVPLLPGNNNFELRGNGLECNTTVKVMIPQNGAEFTLLSATGNCLGSIVGGSYTSFFPLTANNTVTLSVNVTRIGSYYITTDSVNGIQFLAAGSFTGLGVQPVVLTGNGIPAAAGVYNYSYPGLSNNCSFQVNVAATITDDYFPHTANSSWTYEIDNSIIDTARFFVHTQSFMVNGKTYGVFMVTDGNTIDSSGYYRRQNHEYLRYRDVGDFIGFDAPLWAEYKFLDAAAPAGTNWKSNMYSGMVTIGGLPPQPMIVRFSTTILARNTSLDITTGAGTATYNNVIVTEEKYEQLQGSSWVDITAQVGSFKKYYAKNIGMVKYEALNGAGHVTASVELKRYNIF